MAQSESTQRYMAQVRAAIKSRDDNAAYYRYTAAFRDGEIHITGNEHGMFALQFAIMRAMGKSPDRRILFIADNRILGQLG